MATQRYLVTPHTVNTMLSLDAAELRANLVKNCVPTSLLDGEPMEYDYFLVERRRLMAEKIRQWIDVL